MRFGCSRPPLKRDRQTDGQTDRRTSPDPIVSLLGTNNTLDTDYSITDPKEILKELEYFYKDRYKSKTSDRTVLLVNDTPLTFTEQQKVAL